MQTSSLAIYLHLKWCGTAGWLPGYPTMIRAVQAVGVQPSTAGVIIAWVSFAVALFLVWFGWCRDLTTVRSLVVLILFGLFPGAVYNFAIFPTSVALACVVGSILLASRQRFLLSAVLVVIAGLCYPSAWFAAAGLAVGIVVVAWPQGHRQVVAGAIWGLIGLSSLALLFIYDQLRLNHADAYFLFQDQPGTKPTGSPIQQVYDLYLAQNTTQQKLIGKVGGLILAIQAALALGVTAVAAFVTGTADRRGERDESAILAASVAVVVMVGLLLADTAGSWNRSVVIAAPCVICLRRLPMPILVGLLLVIGLVTTFISRYFFVGNLV